MCNGLRCKEFSCKIVAGGYSDHSCSLASNRWAGKENVCFVELSGDVNWKDYGCKLVSPKLNNGDFDYWLVIEFTNMNEALGRDNKGQPPYHVGISAVSPSQAGSDKLASALDCCGFDSEEVSDLVKVEALHSYGIRSEFWQSSGKNARKLISEAKKQADVCTGMFGFYMDAPKNRIGTTGWEALRGDLDSALSRTIASGTIEGRILGKIYGITV